MASYYSIYVFYVQSRAKTHKQNKEKNRDFCHYFLIIIRRNFKFQGPIIENKILRLDLRYRENVSKPKYVPLSHFFLLGKGYKCTKHSCN